MSTVRGVTYSPYTKKFYVGSIPTVDFANDSTYEPIAKLNPERKLGDGRIEFIAHEMVRAAERHQRDAVIDSNEISNITATDMLQEVVGTQWRDYFAINAMTRIAVPKLQLDVPYRNAKMAARQKVPELNVPDETNTEFSKVTFGLWKNVVDVYASDEARIRGTIEPLAYDIAQAAGALGSAANTQIITEIETATTVAKGDWGAATSGISDRNPMPDIMDVVATINDLHYRPTIITMNTRVWADYISNTWVNGSAVRAVDRYTFGTFPLPGFPGITVIVDSGFTNTVATMLDPATFLLGEGPTVAEQYRDPHRGADGYVIRQWLQPKKVTADGSRKMTGVSA